MPSLDVAYASAIQAAYTLGFRDGMNLTLDHLPAWAKDAAAQAMIADGSGRKAQLRDKPEVVEEISQLQEEIAEQLENGEGRQN